MSTNPAPRISDRRRGLELLAFVFAALVIAFCVGFTASAFATWLMVR